MSPLGLALSLALRAGAAAEPAAPEAVRIGVYLNDVHDLEIKNHSYSADLYLWFRWRSARLDPAATLQFTNPYELWGHDRSTSFQKPVRLPGGELYQVVRVQGRFSSKLRMDDYPFDRQVLTVEFEDASLDANELVYLPDEDPLAVNAGLELPGFVIDRPRLRVLSHVYPTRFGDPRAGAGGAFSRARLEVPIHRPVLTYSTKLLLPILSVIFCAALMFLFHPRHVDARVGIGITALLTIVALQITLNDDLPEIAYLVLMDKIYLGSYLFVIAGLAVIVRSTWTVDPAEAGREGSARAEAEARRAIRLDRASLAVLSCLFLAVLAYILLSRS